jgi:hypothetical protein
MKQDLFQLYEILDNVPQSKNHLLYKLPKMELQNTKKHPIPLVVALDLTN